MLVRYGVWARLGQSKWIPLLILGLALSWPALRATPVVLDFESFSDGDVITNQIPGLTFTNAIVLTAGFSLNEIDFPPHSGVNVLSDNGGPISIVFDTPVVGFAAFFTYVQPVSLTAFNGANAQLGSASSMFLNNTATGGDPGSSPNEVLEVSSLAGISSVSITGDPAGGSFAMDDVTLTTSGPEVPEPGSMSLVAAGLGFGLIVLRRGAKS